MATRKRRSARGGKPAAERLFHGSRIRANTYTARQRAAIAATIKPISPEAALADFGALRARDHSRAAGLSRVGNNAVDRFTYPERLNTVGSKGISFYDLLFNKDVLREKRYVQNVLAFCERTDAVPQPVEKTWVRIMSMYFGSVNIFRPLIAAKLYELFRPTCVLDPTMGWGGRLVGAMVLDVPRYIGIDSNLALKRPYREMLKLLRPESKTKAVLKFQDALTVDYSKLKYDMVLTSPPYRNLELYGADGAPPYASKEDWDSEFYMPLFRRTFDGLQPGGFYALNVPADIYKSACVPLLGPAQAVISFEKKERPGTYKESVYVWRKP